MTYFVTILLILTTYGLLRRRHARWYEYIAVTVILILVIFGMITASE